VARLSRSANSGFVRESCRLTEVAVLCGPGCQPWLSSAAGACGSGHCFFLFVVVRRPEVMEPGGPRPAVQAVAQSASRRDGADNLRTPCAPWFMRKLTAMD